MQKIKFNWGAEQQALFNFTSNPMSALSSVTYTKPIEKHFWPLVVSIHRATFTNVNIYHLFVMACDLMQLAGVWRVKCDRMTPIVWTWQSTSRSLCSDSRLVMPAYYSTPIPDWSPSSTINLNWLAVLCDFPGTGENSLCFYIENQSLAKVVISVNLTTM